MSKHFSTAKNIGFVKSNTEVDKNRAKQQETEKLRNTRIRAYNNPLRCPRLGHILDSSFHCLKCSSKIHI